MSESLLRNYRNKKVLITGHTGFKGSWLSVWLHMLGAELTGYALDPLTPDDNFVLSGMQHKMHDNRGDIRDLQHLSRVFETAKPELVFHLAAQPLVGRSYENPVETYETNVMGTMNVLECIRNTPETKVGVIITTDKCYENKEWIWGYRENDSLGGYDPYSSSKACVELLVSSYRESFFNTLEDQDKKKFIATVRAGNVVGGGDWSKDRIIPDCIRSLEKNQSITLRNPHAIRPWQHVLEPLYGYLLLAIRMAEGEKNVTGAWNFGPESESMIEVEKIVQKVIKHWGKGTYSSLKSKQKFHETNMLCLDISKAKRELQWNPAWSIEKTIELTVEWYRQYHEEDVYSICTRQINQYLEDLSKM